MCLERQDTQPEFERVFLAAKMDKSTPPKLPPELLAPWAEAEAGYEGACPWTGARAFRAGTAAGATFRASGVDVADGRFYQLSLG